MRRGSRPCLNVRRKAVQGLRHGSVPSPEGPLDAAARPTKRRRLGPATLQLVCTLCMTLALSLYSIRSARAISDPLEPMNRFVFSLNNQVSGSGAGDISTTYQESVPVSVRQGVRNVFSNLWEPVTAAASLLSLDFENASSAGMRFLINSTIGILGYYDVARDRGWISRYEDLGQVPCSYGLPEGPLLMLPFVGPTTIPDLVGRVVTIVAGYQIVGRAYLPYRIADRVVKVLNGEVSTLSGNTVTYEEARNAYLRQRMADCRNWPRPPVIVPLATNPEP